MLLNNDSLEFVGLLNSNKVEYVVVGAFAVSFHGYPRYTGDLDLLVNSTAENAARVLRVLSEFGFASLDVTAEDLQRPNYIVQLGIHPNRIDLITGISGVSFEEAWMNRRQGEIDGVPTYFIGREELIRNKVATGRRRDLGDADELRKL